MIDLGTALPRRARIAVVACALLGFMGLPFLHQVVRIRSVPAITWHMYGGKHKHVCLLKARDADGAPVDWTTTVDKRRRHRLFPLTPVLRRRRSARSTLRKLCKELGPETRYELKCAHRRKGWSVWYTFADDACADEASRRAR